jgi:hypothetical protein
MRPESPDYHLDVDLAIARFLTSARGRTALEAARDSRDVPAHRRGVFLSDLGSPEEVRAALAQDDLRARACERIPQGEKLFFTPTALQQASAWAVAKDRAARWPAPEDAVLVDIGAGIGIDALAVAATGRPVVAVERDAARAHLLRANAEALGLTKLLEVVVEDAADAPRSGPNAYLDPDRRPDGRRTRDATLFAPPADAWPALLVGFTRALIKLPPGLDPRPEETPWPEAPLEVVALGGRARERRLYVGDWPAQPPRRAVALPLGATVEGVGCPWPEARAVGPGDWLLDPDVSVTLAGLVGDLAAREGLAPCHPRVPYLGGSEARAGLPGHWMRIAEVLPARRRELDAWLRANGIGRLTLRKRGIEEKVETWRRRLHPQGPHAGTLVFTRDLRERWIAYACLDADAALPPTGDP